MHAFSTLGAEELRGTNFPAANQWKRAEASQLLTRCFASSL